MLDFLTFLFLNKLYSKPNSLLFSLQMNYRKPPDRGRPPVTAPQYEFGSKSLNAAFSNLSMMYSGFIGVPHSRTMAKLIGYQVGLNGFA
jgi:hypothetical protein